MLLPNTNPKDKSPSTAPPDNQKKHQLNVYEKNTDQSKVKKTKVSTASSSESAASSNSSVRLTVKLDNNAFRINITGNSFSSLIEKVVSVFGLKEDGHPLPTLTYVDMDTRYHITNDDDVQDFLSFLNRHEVLEKDKFINVTTTASPSVCLIPMHSYQLEFMMAMQNLLENIEGSSSIIVHGFGSDFKFIGRTDVISTFTNCYEEYMDSISKDGRVARDNIVLPYIAAAPGIGKSRILKEIGLFMYKNKHLFPLFISFGNGTKMDVSIETNPLNGLCLRIVYSLVCSIAGIKGNDGFFATLWQKWNSEFKERKVFSLATILSACKKVISPDKPIDFFIGMDEVQIIHSHTKQSSSLGTIVSAIGQYMLQPLCGIVYSLLVGTDHTGLSQSFLGSGYAAKYIPTQAMLPTTDLHEIMDGLVEKYNMLQGWRKNTKLKHYLRTFGGYARGVEFYLEQLFTMKNLSPLDAWNVAKTKILETCHVATRLRSETKIKIMQRVITRKMIEKLDQVVDDDDLTWSDLENRGLVMLEQVKAFDENHNSCQEEKLKQYLVVYPPILLPALIQSNNEIRETYDRLFGADPSPLYGLNWEKVVFDYYYLILTILQKHESLNLTELFPFAKMNKKTAKLEIQQMNSQCYPCTHDSRLQGDLSERTFFNLQIVDSATSLTFNTSKNTDKLCMIKNATDASAGDILIWGMKDAINQDDCVFHLQCKWADSKTTTIDFSAIQNQISKNNEFKLLSGTRNVTVILTGKAITNLPKEDDLPNHLIIVCKDNFAKHFGVLSDHMKYLYSNFLYINECSREGFENVNMDKTDASKIIKIRTADNFGFKNMEDLKTKIGGELFAKLEGKEIIF
ncbi:hypothetical protein C9374_014550 [Naegleria lovaniensis]|uniref:PB1 domain-containing protein n=1 Tax=Naegleria lovaniensis TaxID=51637 RepID=A0AA88GUJ6_NAELO|nr:uncharacterized protein C9374_014550 [Naegleria lovaniensis]KAG2389150.1 hypothetical protein C9374_014550 [Naegleria lovaniensis]